MQERLQKILSQAGIASRREAEGIILDGRVAVNGMIVTELGTKADPDNDMITVDGKAVTVAEHRVYILLYKPVGYMTTMKDPEGRPIVTDLLEKKVRERVYPVGRLDYNTEGLLLLTNDGAFANAMMHPSHEVDKGYLVRVSGKVSEEQIRQLAEGVELDDGRTAPAKVQQMKESENNSWISITIHEGRYRQVRRMCDAVGLSVVRLKRSRYDFLEIGDLKPGEFRYLSPSEVLRLKRQTPPPAPAREKSAAAGQQRKAAPAGSRSAGDKGPSSTKRPHPNPLPRSGHSVRGEDPRGEGARGQKKANPSASAKALADKPRPPFAKGVRPKDEQPSSVEPQRTGKRYLAGERNKQSREIKVEREGYGRSEKGNSLQQERPSKGGRGGQEQRGRHEQPAQERKSFFADPPALRPQRGPKGAAKGPGNGPRGSGGSASGSGQKKKPPRSK